MEFYSGSFWSDNWLTLQIVKYLVFFVLFCLVTPFLLSQKIVPFVDFNVFLRSYENGYFRQVEFQPITGLKSGDELAAYLDIRKNLVLYDGKTKKNITILNAEYEVSDHLMGYKVAGALNVWDDGQIHGLTSFASQYAVRDSIIVFLDGRTRSLNIYKGGNITMLCYLFDNMQIPNAIGDNLLVYKDASQTYNVYWRNKNYEVGVYNQQFQDFPGTDSNGNLNFSVGCDVMCFNDPYTQSFVVFENGEFIDVDPMPANKYSAARGFVVYEDINGNLWLFEDGHKTQLSNFGASNWRALDDVVVWMENGYMFAYQNGIKSEVANYVPNDYMLKNGQIVYRNIMGGVNAFSNGKNYNLTNQVDSEYAIFGEKVLVQLLNKSAIVLDNGQKYFN